MPMDNEQLPSAAPTTGQGNLMQRLGTVAVGNRGIQLSTIDDVFRFAKAVAMSHLCPENFSETDCFLVIQNGLEVGMSPMAALASAYVVNRRATIFGDMPLALVRQSGLLEDYKQEYQGEPFKDDCKCIVTSKRKGTSEPIVTEYSVGDAKIAEVWGKKGAWTTAPKRMLLYRARGFNLRDNFGDVLKGCAIAELDDGENLPGFENAKEAKVVAPNFAQTPAAPLAAPAAPSDQPKRGPGRPRKIEQPPLIPEPEKPEPKPEPAPPSDAKPVDEKTDLIDMVKVHLDADQISIEAFLKLMQGNAYLEGVDPRDIELGHVGLEDVAPEGLQAALQFWDSEVKARLGGKQ